MRDNDINFYLQFKIVNSLTDISISNPKDGDAYYVTDEQKVYVYVDNSITLIETQINDNKKPNRLIRLACESCGAPLNSDLECPHCGAKYIAV